MNEIERVIGAPAFRRLSEALGGCDYTVPSTIEGEAGAALLQAAGREAALLLIKWGGGARIYIPYSREMDVYQRKLTIREMRSRGLPVREIARQFRFEGRYTERQIYALLASTED